VTPFLIALVVLILAWFAVGTIWNVRKGSAAMRWMQGGLPLLGERTTVRWLGTTSVELSIQQAKPPFSQVVLVVFLTPRDVPWLWALAQSRGRRDTLILRATLRRPPSAELDAVDERSWSGREAMRRLEGSGWLPMPSVRAEAGGLLVRPSADRVASLLELTRGAGIEVRRLSLRRGEPHLQLHLDLPPTSGKAEDFFRLLRSIGERAGS